METDNVIVYRNEYAYCAWPHIIILQNGQWILAFSEAMRRRQVTHTDPTAHNVIIRSSDDGRNWTQPVAVPNYDFYGMDDPGIVQLSSGKILMNAYQHLYISGDRKQQDMRPCDPFPWSVGWGPTFVHSSVDDGSTWNTSKVDAKPFKAACTLRSIVELENGQLLLPCYDESRSPSVAFVIRSDDAGKTWKDVAAIAEDPRISFYEPALLVVASKIIAMLRTHEDGDWHLYQCESRDGGMSWTKPRRTPIWGYPAHLLLLRDGRILCSYGYRKPPYGIRACLSNDAAATWNVENELILRDDFQNADLGYPTSVETTGGNIFTAYYGQHEGVTCIQAASYDIDKKQVKN